MFIPDNRLPTHPGEMLLEEFMKPYGITQTKMASMLHVSFKHVNEIVNKKKPMSIELCQRVDKVFGMGIEYWANLQTTYDVAVAKKGPSKELSNIQTFLYTT